jgi:hypothetical protein
MMTDPAEASEISESPYALYAMTLAYTEEPQGSSKGAALKFYTLIVHC